MTTLAERYPMKYPGYTYPVTGQVKVGKITCECATKEQYDNTLALVKHHGLLFRGSRIDDVAYYYNRDDTHPQPEDRRDYRQRGL